MPASTICRDLLSYRNYSLLEKAVATARALKIPVQTGNVLSSDFFYGDDERALLQWKKMGVACRRNGNCRFIHERKSLRQKRACPSDRLRLPTQRRSAVPQERETGFRTMVDLAFLTAGCALSNKA